MALSTGTEHGTGSGRTSLTEHVYAQLKEEILRSRRAPESLLLEHELADEYGYSKTPIREALRLLVQEGWVLVLPRRGYLVRPLKLADVREVFALRQMIEPGLVVEATKRSDTTTLDELEGFVDHQQAAKGERDTTVRAGSNFHLAIAEIAANTRATRILGGLLDEVRRLHHMRPVLDGRLQEASEFEEHRRIIEAMRSGDADAGAEIMRNHLLESLRQMVKALTEG